MSGIFTEADIPQTESHLYHKNHITELTMSRIDNQMLWAIKINTLICLATYSKQIKFPRCYQVAKLPLAKLTQLSIVYILAYSPKALVVKVLDSQSRGPLFKTTGWLQGRLSLSSFWGR